MRTAASLVVGCLVASAGACAGNAAPAAANGASMSLTGPAPVVTRFAGRFNPVSNLNSGTVVYSSARITGTVRLVSAPGSDDDYTVIFEFTSDRGSEELNWSLVGGRCGNGSIPLTPPNQLRSIEVPTTGSVRASRQFRGGLTQQLEYHVNLYAGGGSDLSSVVGCANIKS
ncbi:MAG: hypothetical protein ACRENQ_01360 [Gemmatimonadaceae bacterium]